MNKPILIETINLNKFYGKKKAIDNLNLIVEEGDVYGFLGPNGSGKTTTIRMLTGLIFPSSGEIKINGYDIVKDRERALEQIGAVVENPSYYPYLSGYDNLRLLAYFYPKLHKSKIDEVLEIVKLNDRSKDKVKTYSLGMKQRLGIAMALLANPKLIILDEPTNGLDPMGIKEVRELVKKLARERNITFFISSHFLSEVEQMCSKVAILQNGELLVQGDVKELIGNNAGVITERTNSLENIFFNLTGGQ